MDPVVNPDRVNNNQFGEQKSLLSRTVGYHKTFQTEPEESLGIAGVAARVYSNADLELQYDPDVQITRSRPTSAEHRRVSLHSHLPSANNGYRKLQPFPPENKSKTYKPYHCFEKLIHVYIRSFPKLAKQFCIGFFFISFVLSFMCIQLFVHGALYRVLSHSLLMAIGGLFFAFWILTWILQFDDGTPEMQDVALPIHEGSEAFFLVQYTTITRLAFGVATIIFFLYWFRDTTASPLPPNAISSLGLAVITASTFLFGAFCSALSGYSGMWVSVRANVRVASAARRCYNDALQLCFRGGAFSSVINVSLAVGGISLCLLIIRYIWPQVPLYQTPLLLVGFGFGASLVAMFAQLGGGIYTKAADVGADLVGKIEAGIPEDDPRNPAVIADLVGDNVGDCAGQCADLFESISAEILSAMILGGTLAHDASLSNNEAIGYVMFPLAVHCMDIVISSIGVLLVKTKPGLPDSDSATGGPVNPLTVMIKSYLITCVLSWLGFGMLCRIFLKTESQPYSWLFYWLCGAIGMSCAFIFVLITQYYTDYEYPKVRRIAEASITGPATNIITGLSVGMESTGFPILLIGFCVLSAYYCGLSTNLLPHKNILAGLFGTAVATMGMLCTAVYVLSMSSFGPIADNAGGIAEMSQQEQSVRAITDRLDAVGNVTKANTKGFSVGSASLACFLLFSAFLDEISAYTGEAFEIVDIAIPEVFVGGLLGSCLIFIFCAWSLEAVGRAAQQVVQEVRRQFSEYPGIMTFIERPDYHTCVAIVSRSALKEMIWPGLLAVTTPIFVGVLFRFVGYVRDMPHLGAQVLAGFLMFATTTGILMALFLNNSGGSWDNAKKYIETGAFGGKGSEAHKAAVVGDTVGDPAKDTAGPSVHVLIKLIATVTLVLVPVFVSGTSVSQGL